MININTTNRSFIQLSSELKNIGVSNNDWMLKLLNEDLLKLDPYDENLEPVDKVKIILECIENPIYFFREIYRIPTPFGNREFSIRRNTAAKLYCFLNNISTLDLCGKQSFKLGIVIAKYTYLFLFAQNKQFLIQGKDVKDSKYIISNIAQSINILPNYIREYSSYNNCRDTISMLHNKNNNNTIRIGRSPKNTKESYISAGTGISNIDYICINDMVHSDYFINYYQRIIPCSINSNIDNIGCAYETKYLEDCWNEMVHWDDSFYDKDISEIKSLINNTDHSSSGILIHYEPEDIGINVKEMYKLFLNDIETTRRELSIHPYDKDYNLIIE